VSHRLGEIFSIDASDKGYVSRIHEELLSNKSE
jgi:hypothetical protein